MGTLMTTEDYIDGLMKRKREIVVLFFKKINLQVPMLKKDFREALVLAAGDHLFSIETLKEFFAEMANDGKRRLYFYEGIQPVAITNASQLSDYLEAKQATNTQVFDDEDTLIENIPRITQSKYVEGQPGFVQIEFDQARSEQSRLKELDRVEPHPEYGMVKFEASRVFPAPRISFAYWQPIEGTLVLSLVDQENSGDYNHAILSIHDQLCTAFNIKLGETRSLVNLVSNLEAQPDIDASQGRKKDSSGYIEVSSNEEAHGFSGNETFADIWHRATNMPTVRMRVCFSKKSHSQLLRDMVLWVNSYDGFISIRHDATSTDMDYVVSKLKRLL